MMSSKEEKEWYDKAWFAPALWMGKAENHILSAEYLNNRVILLFEKIKISASNENIPEQVALLETIPFLCGIAIENAIKALIIYRNPKIKSQDVLKQLDQWKTNHDILTMLEKESVNFDKKFVERIQKSLVWAGKYPLPNRFNNKYSLHEYSTNDVIDTKEIILQIKQLIQLK